VTTRSVSNLLRRLSRAGFKRDFVRLAILPDWWEFTLESDATLLPDLEVRVARFLGMTVSDVRDPSHPLAFPTASSTVLRKAANVDAERLRPAIHAAHRVAEAVVRNLRNNYTSNLPTGAEEWRREMGGGRTPITLECMLQDLWKRGIPVIPMECLPSPSFQGLATVIEDRPVIVIGQKHDAPGRVGFFVAHETGHIVAGDCDNGRTIVDEEETTSDSSDIEKNADQYASHVLLGGVAPNTLKGDNYRELATRAHDIERETGAEAGALIFHWARNSGEFQTASMAVAALYQEHGARELMARFMVENVSMDEASETDRALLDLATSEPESTTASD
jgi:IrrE N-terminal-like domain